MVRLIASVLVVCIFISSTVSPAAAAQIQCQEFSPAEAELLAEYENSAVVSADSVVGGDAGTAAAGALIAIGLLVILAAAASSSSGS